MTAAPRLTSQPGDTMSPSDVHRVESLSHRGRILTWILGSGVTFGYGALISDVRASWVDAQGRELYHIDVLQKIYPVGHWMIAGFSGSVAFGFQTIADLQRFFRDAPANQSYLPERAAWTWYRRARRAFALAPTDIQALSASIILVGASPMMNGPFPWARCMRMRAPSFEPERIKGPSWTSIGIGSTHETARQLADQTIDQLWDTHARGEIGRPGGTAVSVATTVGLELARTPVPFVSSQLQVGIVRLGRHDIHTLEGQLHGPAWSSWKLVESRGLATSWDEFQGLASGAGFRAASATT